MLAAVGQEIVDGPVEELAASTVGGKLADGMAAGLLVAMNI